MNGAPNALQFGGGERRICFLWFPISAQNFWDSTHIWPPGFPAVLPPSIVVLLAGCALLLAPVAATAAGRGPSTPEERAKALAVNQRFHADPLDPSLNPDLRASICTALDSQKGNKKDAQTLFNAMFLAQIAYAINHPGKRSDHLDEYQAGVDGLLHAYELLAKSKPKDQQPYLDDLIQQRNAGTLTEFVKQRAAAICKN